MSQPGLHDIETIFSAISIIALLLVAGLWLRRQSVILTKLFIPGSVIAGMGALLLGPDVIGAVAQSMMGSDSFLSSGLFGQEIPSIWRALPSLLINIVFACLLLGKDMPGPRQIWQQAGPIVCYGQSIAWGQYVVGLLLAIFLLVPLFNMDPKVAALIEIGFEGGHGTAAGLAPLFERLDFADGVDLALGLASVGLLSAILSGVILISWARKRGYLMSEEQDTTFSLVSDRTSDLIDGAPTQFETGDAGDTIDPMSFHLGLVAMSILVGWLILEVLITFEKNTWGLSGIELIAHVPLFPMAMIGGAIVNFAVSRFWSSSAINRDIVNRIGGFSLDVIIVAALATLSLSVINDNLLPFLILAVAGIAWNIIGFIILAPRLIPGPWFERGIPNFGQSMGMTVTGMILFQMADPKNRSGGLERFGYKQLMFEPVVGGGLFTAVSMPLIHSFGTWIMLGVTGALLIFWLALGVKIANAVEE